MDLKEKIKLHEGDKYIELPLGNILRFALIHFTDLRREFHMETGESNIGLFWKWLIKRLEIKEGDSVLM